MTDRGLIGVLFDEICRGGRSLLQYAGESYPWARDAAGVGHLTALEHMIRAEQEATAALIKYLQRRHIAPPHLSAYPVHFTNFNFLDVDRLLVLLVEHQGQDVAALEADLRRVDEPEARRLLQHQLEVKRRHLESLQKLIEPPQPAGQTVAPVPAAV